MTKKQTPDTVDDIVAENAWLHQLLSMQRTIQAGIRDEVTQLKENNASLKRIIAYILMQNNNTYRILHKTLIVGDSFAGNLNMEIDSITGDWLISLNNTKE